MYSADCQEQDIGQGYDFSHQRPFFWAKRHYIQPLRSLLQGCTRRNIKKLYIFNSFYLLDSCSQSLKWSFLGFKKGWATSTLFSLRGFVILISDEHPRPFHMGVPPRAQNILVYTSWLHSQKNLVTTINTGYEFFILCPSFPACAWLILACY